LQLNLALNLHTKEFTTGIISKNTSNQTK